MYESENLQDKSPNVADPVDVWKLVGLERVSSNLFTATSESSQLAVGSATAVCSSSSSLVDAQSLTNISTPTDAAAANLS